MVQPVFKFFISKKVAIRRYGHRNFQIKRIVLHNWAIPHSSIHVFIIHSYKFSKNFHFKFRNRLDTFVLQWNKVGCRVEAKKLKALFSMEPVETEFSWDSILNPVNRDLLNVNVIHLNWNRSIRMNRIWKEIMRGQSTGHVHFMKLIHKWLDYFNLLCDRFFLTKKISGRNLNVHIVFSNLNSWKRFEKNNSTYNATTTRRSIYSIVEITTFLYYYTKSTTLYSNSTLIICLFLSYYI